ncbi:hypothetical protein [Natrinema salinisoli]|uniref:hypothetical protein n=1 Tax=Natrinema salinisoli TaxID=2878535 RepID=UPI001CF01820|nr:hypothetical protein [Natrinema salinisoli]
MLDVSFDYAVLVVGLFAVLGLIRTVLSNVINKDDTDLRRIGVFLVVIAYVLSKLVPSRFVTVSGTIDSAIGAVTIAFLVVGVVLLFRRN